MIDATTRWCEQCHEKLPPEATEACPQCGRALCPPHGTWPRELKRWLFLRLALDFFAPWHRSGEQALWEALLAAKMRGRQWGTTILSHAAGRHECYQVALTQVSKWEEAGRPGVESYIAKHAA